MAYWRIRLGEGNLHHQHCVEHGIIFVNYGVTHDLDGFPVERVAFNEQFVEAGIEVATQGKGALFRFYAQMEEGDIVLSPDGLGNVRVGRVNSAYNYGAEAVPFSFLHQRGVDWEQVYPLAGMTEPLKRTINTPLTLINLNEYEAEINALEGNGNNGGGGLNQPNPVNLSGGGGFVLEKYLEEYIIDNWENIDRLNGYEIHRDGERDVGQQYRTNTGQFMDILAFNQSQNEWLVIELKKGKTSDQAVGQVLRYMGYVRENLMRGEQGKGRKVKGLIIGLEGSENLRLALLNTPDVEFLRYELRFALL